MKALKDMIIGNTISQICPIEDYIQIFFIDGSILNLNNDVVFSHQLNQYSYKNVTDFTLTENIMRIIVNGNEITMSMKDVDYHTTEAFEFCTKDEEWIIE